MVTGGYMRNYLESYKQLQDIKIENAQDDPCIGPAGRDLGHHGVLGILVILEQKGIRSRLAAKL